MSVNEKRILFYPLDSYGHINACIGLAERIIQFDKENNDGVRFRVVFALERSWTGQLSRYGFEEAIYVDPVREKTNGPNDHWINSMGLIVDTLPEDSLYKARNQSIVEFEEFIFNELNFDDQLKIIIDKIDPHVIVMDHYFTCPAVYKSGRKWVKMTSATPLSCLPHPDLPPSSSGYATDGDREQWKIFEKASEQHYGPVLKRFNDKLLELGIPNLPENLSFHPSPYLNIYAYPEELDYLDIRPLPKNWKRFDHFIRSLKSDLIEKFKLPEKLESVEGRLIYVSMGSMGCYDLKLMKRFADILGHSPNRFLMSLGPNQGKIDLPRNIYSEKFLPQIEILPGVDLVITHGGNNSVVESLYHGKPMIINPLFADQYDNAQRITEQGYGHRINAYTCEADELLSLIEQILDDLSMLERCEKISKRMKSENSTEMAAQAIIDIIDQ